MKIFYAVQATGNGHISRAKTILPFLYKYGSVDVFLSGSNFALNTSLPIKYRSRGVSLEYNQRDGSIDVWKTAKNLSFTRLWKDAKDLPIEQYDLIINDFDAVTSLACRIKNRPSIHFGHQASFQSMNVPRPLKKNIIGEWILSNYASGTETVGLHFKQYDSFIYPPIIKESVLHAAPINKGHITVYLAQYTLAFLSNLFSQFMDVEFHVFDRSITQIRREGNIVFYPIHKELFDQSLVSCHGIISGAGFETPAEALYLEKKLLVVPISGQYEQQCNAAALVSDFNVIALPAVDHTFSTVFYKWVNDRSQKKLPLKKTTAEIIELLIS